MKTLAMGSRQKKENKADHDASRCERVELWIIGFQHQPDVRSVRRSIWSRYQSFGAQRMSYIEVYRGDEGKYIKVRFGESKGEH